MYWGKKAEWIKKKKLNGIVKAEYNIVKAE